MQFVLVHGAWHGGWAWERVAPALAAAGHGVEAPTLTGVAERAAEAGPAVDLDTHVTDILGHVVARQLDRIVLVGHSYGGMVISGVADLLAERIAHIVYFDAFVPADGQALLDFLPAQRRADTIAGAERLGGDLVPPPDARGWGIEGALRDELNARMTPHPFGTMRQPLALRRGGGLAVARRSYIDCTAPASAAFVETKARLKRDPSWRYRTLPTGHEAMFTLPRETADLLLRIAAED